MAATAWSVLPPIITIVLALWTKEVYMSLIIGIFSGALLFTGGNILESILTMFTVMSDKVGSNVNILVFLVILGILVAAISRSGATQMCIRDSHNPAPVGNKESWPIHRPAPKFDEQETSAQVLETGIKVVDLIAPYSKGGKTGLFGGAGVGKTVLIMELDVYKRQEYSRMAESVNPYGDGKAAARIIQAILYHYGLADGRPDVFEG